MSAAKRKAPLALRAPDGRIFAYACAHCLHIGSICGVRAETREIERIEIAKESRRMARLCGECCCGAFSADHEGGWYECPACVAKQDARDAESAARGSTVACPDCVGVGRLTAHTADGREVVADCCGCGGDGLVWRPIGGDGG